ncbi:MAG: GDSL-type esterase/lipase family protein [Woeseiaceae bacterium]
MNISLQRSTWMAALLCLLGTTACAERSPYSATSPTRFSSAIAAFERRDESNPPAQDAVLFVGSSSIRMWAPHIAKDLHPIPVVARGFGGSNMHDVNFFFDRIISPYRPRAIVVYVGENDIAQGISPKQLLAEYESFVATVKSTLPDTRVYYLSIKPAPARRGAWKTMSKANQLIADYSSRDAALFFVDVATPMLDASGGPRADIHIDDGIHMNRQGYKIWTDILKPVLLANEIALTPSAGVTE